MGKDCELLLVNWAHNAPSAVKKLHCSQNVYLEENIIDRNHGFKSLFHSLKLQEIHQARTLEILNWTRL